MCDPITASVVGTTLYRRNQGKKAQAAQNAAMEEQNAKNKAAQEAAERLGPAAKTMDLTQEASVYNNLKKNKIAMQQGIMGTMKTSSLEPMIAANTQKATLGS